MVVTLIPMMGAAVFAEGETAGFAYTAPDGQAYQITAADVDQFGVEDTYMPLGKDGTPNTSKAVTAKFAKLADILEAKGAALPECVYTVVCSDGKSFGYRPEIELSVYVKEDGSFNTAVNKGYGFQWASNFTAITGKNHDYGDGNTCQNTYNYFDTTAGSQTSAPCGAAAFKYTDPEGKEVRITAADVDQFGVEDTYMPLGKDGKPNESKAVTAKFAKLTDILEAKGAALPECVYTVDCSDGKSFGYKPEIEICVYIKDDGSFNTAVNNGYGFQWASNFTAITGKKHDYDADNACKNTYNYFDTAAGSQTSAPCGAKAFKYTDPDGQEVRISTADIDQFGVEDTYMPLGKDGKPNESKAVTAKFAKLTDILEAKGAALPECVYTVDCSDGKSFGYKPEIELSVYVKDDGSFNTAVNNGYGFQWASNFTAITGKSHEYGADGTCQNTYNYFDTAAGSQTSAPCGETRTFTYTDPNKNTFEFKAADVDQYGVEDTYMPLGKDGKPNESKAVTAKFAKLTDILEAKGAALPECVYTVACNDGKSFGYRPDIELCVYVKTDGTLNTAVNNGYGFQWASNVLSITGKNHEFGEDETCHNTYNYFDTDAGSQKAADCGEKIQEITPSVKLAAKTYTWDGKAKAPAVTVRNGDAVLVKDVDYTVVYDEGKNVGLHKVTVNCIGKYKGSATASFTINPKGTKLSKVTAGKKKFTAKWAKQTKKMSKTAITGYELQYGLKKSFKSAKKANVKGASKASKTVLKLKSKKIYYVRIRTYKKVSGKTYYSPWSTSKKVKVK